jgi:hypothetical protein
MDSCVLQAAPTMVFCMNAASVETDAHVSEALRCKGSYTLKISTPRDSSPSRKYIPQWLQFGFGLPIQPRK